MEPQIIFLEQNSFVFTEQGVAKLHQVKTRRMNEVIKRKVNRFLDRFCFQLNDNEIDELSLRSQFVTLNKSNNLRGYNIKYLPFRVPIVRLAVAQVALKGI